MLFACLFCFFASLLATHSIAFADTLGDRAEAKQLADRVMAKVASDEMEEAVRLTKPVPPQNLWVGTGGTDGAKPRQCMVRVRRACRFVLDPAQWQRHVVLCRRSTQHRGLGGRTAAAAAAWRPGCGGVPLPGSTALAGGLWRKKASCGAFR